MAVLQNMNVLYRRAQILAYVVIATVSIAFAVAAYQFRVLQTVLMQEWGARLDKSFVLVGGDIFEIQRVRDETAVRAIEAVGHVEDFHDSFFNLSPDPDQIKKSIEGHALNLVDESGKIHYDRLVNQGYFRELIANNVTQFIEYDTLVQIDTLEDYRVRFTVEATQYLERSTSLVKRRLKTQGYLRNEKKTSENLFGFLIAELDMVENYDVEVIERK